MVKTTETPLMLPWQADQAGFRTFELRDASGAMIARISVDDSIVEVDALMRMLVAAPEMRGLLARVTDNDPIYDDPDEGAFCTFCMKQQGHGRDRHTDDCEWVAARALVAHIDGRQP